MMNSRCATVTIAKNDAATGGDMLRTWNGCTVDSLNEFGREAAIQFTDHHDHIHFAEEPVQ